MTKYASLMLHELLREIGHALQQNRTSDYRELLQEIVNRGRQIQKI
jgi:cobalamin biosynthesis protein CobD/CbiB